MNILALDLGTTTGWATAMISTGFIGTNCGTVTFKNGRFEGGGMRFLRFRKWLSEIRGHVDPKVVYFEEVRRHAGTDAAHIYGGLMGHLTAWCEEHGIPYSGVPVGTIKRHATGKGNADKGAMIEAARRRWHNPADDNEADAIALLYWAKEQGAPT